MQAFGIGMATRLASGCLQKEFYYEVQLDKSCNVDNNSVLVFGFLKKEMWNNSEKYYPLMLVSDMLSTKKSLKSRFSTKAAWLQHRL